MVGVGTGPPNVLLAPKPTSSVRMSRTFGAPLGALTSCGKSLVDSSTVRPMCPLKVCSGRGSTSCALADSATDAISAKLNVAKNVTQRPTELFAAGTLLRGSASIAAAMTGAGYLMTFFIVSSNLICRPAMLKSRHNQAPIMYHGAVTLSLQ